MMRLTHSTAAAARCAHGITLGLAIGAAALLPFAAHAARPWLLPSAGFIDAGDGPAPIVSIDAAVSEDLFEFDRVGLQLDGLTIVGPDGAAVPADALVTSRRRNGFEFKLTLPGTYRVANVSDLLMVSYKVGGETKRWRGAASAFAKEVPADAQDVQVTRLQNRVETFVTLGSAGGKALAASGVGLEAIPLGAPTDLSVGDSSSFKLLHDGKPVADVDVTVVRGGNRYRYKLGEIALKTDAQGVFNITWAEAGRYWIGASVGPRGPGGVPGTAAQPTRRASYSATLEVMPK